MIENVETYSCEEHGCGRKFAISSSLMEHYKRRHVKLYEKYTNKNENNNEQVTVTHAEKSKKMLDELYNKINIIEQEALMNKETGLDYLDSDEEDKENNNKKTNENNIENINENIIENINENISNSNDNNENNLSSFNMTTSSFFTDKAVAITDELIGIGTKYADYDEIDEINLEDKSLTCFRTKRNINFTDLLYVTTLNISKNLIKDISHLSHLNTIKFLNISSNRIDDISPIENLEFLEILQADNNEITSISSLNMCRSIRVLELADNKIKYESSTYKTLKNLEKLREMTIKNNPFLDEVFGFKHLFIQKYPKISKLDREEITDLDREFAIKFMNENSILNQEITRPYSAKIEATISKIPVEEKRIEGSVINVNNKVITQIEYKSDKTKEANPTQKSAHPLRIIKRALTKTTSNDIKKNPDSNSAQLQIKRELDEVRKENKILAEKNKVYEFEMQSLKTEMENLLSLNKEYEKIIQKNENKSALGNREDEEKKKLKQEVELWKREYCDLLDKSMSTNVSTSRILSASAEDRNKDIERDKMRQTAQLFQIRRKNSLDDSLNSEEEINNENDSDQEIDDLLRKSVTNLATLKTEIKILSKATNHQDESSSSSRKQSLSKPKIIKECIEVKPKLFNNCINKK